MPVIFENRSIVAPPPVVPSSDFVLNTKFDGVSWVEVVDFGDDKDYRLDGTDASTGQVFTASSPQIWGSYWGDASLTLQVIAGTGRTETPDDLFTRSFTTVDGMKCLGIARTDDPYVGVDQAAMRLKTAAAMNNQSMIVNRGKVKIPAGLDNSTGNFFVLQETKFNYSDKKCELSLWYEGSTWYWKSSFIRAGSGAEVYGNTSGPYANSVPTQTSYFANSTGSNFYRSISDPRGKWITYVVGMRPRDAAGTVAGGGSNGWWYVAIGVGTTTTAVDFEDCTQEFYLEGINMADTISSPSSDPAITINFPLNHYTDFNCANLPFYWTDVQIATSWPSDSPAGIPAGAV